MLQNFAHKTAWRPQLSPVCWKTPLLQTHIRLQKRVFPGLALAVWGRGVNRPTEKCILVAYVTPIPGALTAESSATLCSHAPNMCLLRPRMSPLLSSLARRKHQGPIQPWLLAVPNAGWHVSLCTTVALGTSTPCWNEMQVLTRHVIYALLVPKWSLSLVKWLWYTDKWS